MTIGPGWVGQSGAIFLAQEYYEKSPSPRQQKAIDLGQMFSSLAKGLDRDRYD